MKQKHLILALIGGIAIIAITAGASAYVATQVANEKPTVTSSTQKITWKDEQRVAAQQPQAPAEPACDDANIVGAAIGAVGGGLVGNQIGSGKGQDLATIGGAIGGGYLGKEYIPTHNTLCPD